MRRIVTLGAALAILASIAWSGAVVAKSANTGSSGNSVNAQACLHGGWTNLYTRTGLPFKNQGACVSYAAQGGQLIVAAALACLDGGWEGLGPTPAQRFQSEQECVDFVNGGGVPVAASSDLALTKTVSDATPNVGDTITFTVTLTNAGPAMATGVEVTDLLPPGLTFVAASLSQGSYDNVTGLWSVGSMSAGTSATLTLVATVTSPGPQTNTAQVSDSDQFDPDPSDNAASATETPQQADLELAKTTSDPTPSVGDTITFTVTLTNAGPDTATGVAVTDLLPAGLTFVAASASQGSYDNVTGLWSVGTVTTSTPQTLVLTATVVTADANTATITAADQFDPDPADNSATAGPDPLHADLSITKTVSDATPNVGDTITFTVTLTNAGPAMATGVEVTDLLPPGLTFVAASLSQGSYDNVTGLWSVGSMSAGTSATLTLVATVTSPGPQTNTAQVSDSDQFDPDPSDNAASATETPQQADLELAKTTSDPTPSVGDTITFTVTLTNAGPDTATGVAVTDLLPAGLTFVAASASQGSYDNVTGLWSVGTVTTSTPQTLVLTATVVTADANTATITAADQFDPDPADNSASV